MEFLEIMGIFGLVLLVKHTGPGFRLQKVAQIVPLLKAVLIQVNFFFFHSTFTLPKRHRRGITTKLWVSIIYN